MFFSSLLCHRASDIILNGRNVEKTGKKKIDAQLLRTNGSEHLQQVILEGRGSTEHKLNQGTPLFCPMQWLSSTVNGQDSRI